MGYHGSCILASLAHVWLDANSHTAYYSTCWLQLFRLTQPRKKALRISHPARLCACIDVVKTPPRILRCMVYSARLWRSSWRRRQGGIISHSLLFLPIAVALGPSACCKKRRKLRKYYRKEKQYFAISHTNSGAHIISKPISIVELHETRKIWSQRFDSCW